MSSQEVRQSFLKYFKTQSHTIVPSSPVVPNDDPTLLFINAGMNQFKDVFLGSNVRPYKRATSAQKCIRVGGKHNDLENVGHTSRHLTFFEMIGNFSFGDYFKKGAIGFAYDVFTHIFGFDPEKVWASVYTDDDEAYELWLKHLPAKRIVRMGAKDNFWSMGDTGPCGPCSELLYDRGCKYGDAPSPLKDLSGERYLEFWNLVFMQYNRLENGTMQNLPNPSIDTGAGLERIISLKMDVDNVFKTDILRGIIAKTENLSKIKYDEENKIIAPAFNVIADHLRTLSFAIADGVIPSNIDRGYVLRKVLRRSVRYGKRLGFTKPFLAKLVPTLIDFMGEAYPELNTAKNQIEEILTLEEENFIKTLKRGGSILNNIIDNSKKIISGDDAFKLKDTYGFPIEEILLIAKDSMLNVDLKKFNELEEKAKELSKKSHKKTNQTLSLNIFSDFVKTHSPTEFVGYDENKIDTTIVAIVKDDVFVDEIKIDDKASIVLKTTPFYAEMGGQIGDSGNIYIGENIFKVKNTLSPYPGIIVHIGQMKSGSLKKGEKVHAKIDIEKRTLIENNHSATHLLHHSLFDILGPHIKQAGSIVDEKRIRFDFTHNKALTYEEIKQIEKFVNNAIRKNTKIDITTTSIEKAQKDSSIKQLFGEKYGEEVRVTAIGKAKELCGGCHTSYTGNIGLFKIEKESSIAAGIRRIEAVTGNVAEDFVYDKQEFISYISSLIKMPESKIPEKIESLLSEHDKLGKIIKQLRKNATGEIIEDLIKSTKKIKDVSFIGKKIDATAKELGDIAATLLDKIKSGIVVLANSEEENSKCSIVIKISSDIVEKGILANQLIKEISDIIQGGGGGKMNAAQAGGKNSKGIEKAFEKIISVVEKKC